MVKQWIKFAFKRTLLDCLASVTISVVNEGQKELLQLIPINKQKETSCDIKHLPNLISVNTRAISVSV